MAKFEGSWPQANEVLSQCSLAGYTSFPPAMTCDNRCETWLVKEAHSRLPDIRKCWKVHVPHINHMLYTNSLHMASQFYHFGEW